MKKLLLITALFLLGNFVHAQDKKKQDRKKQDKNQVSQDDRMGREEYFVFRDGQLFILKLGVHVMIQEPVKLSNGIMLKPNGSYELNGEQQQLKNEEFMDLAGNRYSHQEAFEQRKIASRPDMQKKHD